jgi:hypothetical protein
VLPSAFKGLVIVECDCSDGASEQRRGNIVTYAIPLSGQIRVRNCSAFREWHKLRVETETGHVLPTDTDDRQIHPDDEVRVWELGATAGDKTSGVHSTMRFLVGTYRDHEEFVARPDTFMGSRSPQPVGGK